MKFTASSLLCGFLCLSLTSAQLTYSEGWGVKRSGGDEGFRGFSAEDSLTCSLDYVKDLKLIEKLTMESQERFSDCLAGEAPVQKETRRKRRSIKF